MKYPVYNLKGDKVKDIELSDRVFGVKIKPEVIHQVVVAQLSSARVAIADTKGKGEVRGGGKKPWRQKGTGRARHGSSRSPIWKGGGVVFGPKSARNFYLKVNKKQKQLALFMCLSDKVQDKTLAVIDKLELASGKTKDLSLMLKDIKGKIAEIKNGKKTLLIIDSNDKKLIKAAMNLKSINTISADSINCVDLLKYDTVLATEESIKKIDKHFKKYKEKIKK